MIETTTPFLVSYGFLWVVVGFQTLLLIGLVRAVYRLRLSGVSSNPLYGREAPQFKAKTIAGASVDSRDYDDRVRAVLFVSPGCPTCSATFQEVAALKSKTTGNVIVVCKGDLVGCRRLAEEYELTVPVIPDESSTISELYNIPGVPTAVLIDEKNIIQSFGYPQREELARVLERPRAPEEVTA
jgi:peroxiredoxin